MTPDEALRAIATVEALNNGTRGRAELISRLTKVLIERPEEFWAAYLENFPGESISPVSADDLLRTRTVTKGTTFKELASIIGATGGTGHVRMNRTLQGGDDSEWT